MIKSAKKSFFIIEKMKKYRKCPALVLVGVDMEGTQNYIVIATTCSQSLSDFIEVVILV